MPVEPFDSRRPDQPLFCTAGFAAAVLRQPLHRVFALAGRLEYMRCIRAHGFQHLIEGAIGTVDASALTRRLLSISVAAMRDRIVDVAASAGAGQHLGCRGDRKDSGQRAEAAERALFSRFEQLIAPRDGGIHRPLPLGQIACAVRRAQRVRVEARSKSFALSAFIQRAASSRASGSASRRRQMAAIVGALAIGRIAKSGQDISNAFEKVAPLLSPREVVRRHRGGGGRVERERRDDVFALAAEPQRGAAGREHAQRLHAAQQLGHQRRRLQQVLEVVEHQQRRPFLVTPRARVAAG